MQIELPHGGRPCTPGALWNHLINLLGRSSRAVEVEVLVIPGAMRLHWCFIGASLVLRCSLLSCASTFSRSVSRLLQAMLTRRTKKVAITEYRNGRSRIKTPDVVCLPRFACSSSTNKTNPTTFHLHLHLSDLYGYTSYLHCDFFSMHDKYCDRPVWPKREVRSCVEPHVIGASHRLGTHTIDCSHKQLRPAFFTLNLTLTTAALHDAPLSRHA